MLDVNDQGSSKCSHGPVNIESIVWAEFKWDRTSEGAEMFFKSF
jgi:hypothetical protein